MNSVLAQHPDFKSYQQELKVSVSDSTRDASMNLRQRFQKVSFVACVKHVCNS